MLTITKHDKQPIVEKLFNIQQALKAPKGQHNDYSNFDFRSASDIMQAVKPHLRDCRSVLTVSDEIVQIGERYYLKSTATLSDNEYSVSTSALAREPENRKGMDASQITGTASSYACKYALEKLLAIDNTKDIDSYDNRGSNNTHNEITLINRLIETRNVFGIKENWKGIIYKNWESLDGDTQKQLIDMFKTQEK